MFCEFSQPLCINALIWDLFFTIENGLKPIFVLCCAFYSAHSFFSHTILFFWSLRHSDCVHTLFILVVYTARHVDFVFTAFYSVSFFISLLRDCECDIFFWTHGEYRSQQKYLFKAPRKEWVNGVGATACVCKIMV